MSEPKDERRDDPGAGERDPGDGDTDPALGRAPFHDTDTPMARPSDRGERQPERGEPPAGD